MSVQLVDEFTTSKDELFQRLFKKVFTYLLHTLKKGPLVIPVTLNHQIKFAININLHTCFSPAFHQPFNSYGTKDLFINTTLKENMDKSRIDACEYDQRNQALNCCRWEIA